MFGVCMMMVSAAMVERAQPGGDSWGIIILIVEASCFLFVLRDTG